MSQPERLHQVVVAYDFSPTAEEALARAVEVACRAPQHVLHVVAAIDSSRGLPAAPTDDVSYAYAEKVQGMISERITAAFAGRSSAADVHFYVHARIGKPAEEILDLAQEVGAELIFIGTHGRTGVSRLMFGSVAEKVVREAGCTVMVVREREYKDVTLEHVVASDQAKHRYVRPHRYSYTDQRVTTRPDAWPVS
ncbi:MAG: universal stress protein [Deltaproteobacteria bacterium]|nr:universal stress protein [Deltaproteobacteria bacterium]